LISVARARHQLQQLMNASVRALHVYAMFETNDDVRLKHSAYTLHR